MFVNEVKQNVFFIQQILQFTSRSPNSESPRAAELCHTLRAILHEFCSISLE